MIDTHSHIDAEEFLDDREDTVLRAKEAGVEAILIPNINAATLSPIERLCADHSQYLYPMIGLHPEDVNPDHTDIPAFMETMEHRLSQQHPFIAIGEVGLDFYWDTTYRELQLDVFEQQVLMAANFRLPLMIHARNAHDDIVRIIQKHHSKGLTGVFHCFSGDASQAAELLRFTGFMLGIGGVLTFKKSTLPQVLAEAVPPSRVVLETDAPYLAPVPMRGKRNEPAFIRYTLQRLAQIYGLSPEQMEEITNNNAKNLFQIAL